MNVLRAFSNLSKGEETAIFWAELAVKMHLHSLIFAEYFLLTLDPLALMEHRTL